MWEKLSRKVRAYRSLEGAHGFQTVMADLAQFCHYNRPITKINPITNAVDPIAMAIAAGRHEVFLRILTMMDTNDEKLRSWMHDDMVQEQRLNDDETSY